jgi:hypothetical protein
MKKVVHFDAKAGVDFVAGHAIVHRPLDHTSPYVSNNHQAYTSDVVKRNEDGSFETLNSIYVPTVVPELEQRVCGGGCEVCG